MRHFKITKRHDFLTVDLNETNINDILSIYSRNLNRMLYAVKNNRLHGFIGTTEINKMKQTGSIEINTNGFFIENSKYNEELCAKYFDEHLNWKGIPVVDDSHEILFELVCDHNQREFYDELKFSFREGINHLNRKDKIVVSMTTHDERMQTAYLAIKSLMYQSMRPDKIVLYLAEGSGDGVLVNEDELVNAGLEVKRGVENITCHKKYYYAMQEYDDSIIITADDDRYYDDHFIEDLYNAHCDYPEAVICEYSERIRYEGDKICKYITWTDGTPSVIPESQICIKSFAGVLYPIGEYRKQFLNKEAFLSLSEYNDDLWVTASLQEMGVKVFNIGNLQSLQIEETLASALWNEESTAKRNDIYVKNLKEYYRKAFRV